MSRFEECQDAVSILSEFWDAHRYRARKIGSIGIKVLSESEDGTKDFGVSVGVLSGPVPPKYASTIDLILEEYDLKRVPVSYTEVGRAVAN